MGGHRSPHLRKPGRKSPMKETLQEFLDHAPVFVCRPGGEILYWSQGCEELFGYSSVEARGRISHELLRTVFPDDLLIVESKLRHRREWTGRLRHTTKDGRVIWVLASWRLRQSVEPVGPIVIEQNADITAQVELEKQKQFLTLELEHRVKNLLVVVQSLARTSFLDAPEEHRTKFENRLVALAEANRLLHEANWDEADLHELVVEIAHALGAEGRVRAHGPKVTVGSKDAIGVALAFHELCTNALKHGSLSVLEGHVEVTWTNASDQQHIDVRWEEKGGPSPIAPGKRGFGMRLIQRAVAGQIGSPVEIRFEPCGVVCEMRLNAMAAENASFSE